MDKARTKQLVKRAKSGDDDAFTELIELYSERIYNLGLRILRRPDDAADVLQETFIKVYEKINTFDGRADFFTWLYRIATNEALMRIRKEKRTVLSDNELEKYYDRPNSVEIQEWQDVPLRDMLSREFKKHLDKAVEALPEIYRSVFVLRDLESISTRETSKILGITETNVKVRLKRARMYLREQLIGYMNEYQGIPS